MYSPNFFGQSILFAIIFLLVFTIFVAIAYQIGQIIGYFDGVEAQKLKRRGKRK